MTVDELLRRLEQIKDKTLPIEIAYVNHDKIRWGLTEVTVERDEDAPDEPYILFR